MTQTTCPTKPDRQRTITEFVETLVYLRYTLEEIEDHAAQLERDGDHDKLDELLASVREVIGSIYGDSYEVDIASDLAFIISESQQ